MTAVNVFQASVAKDQSSKPTSINVDSSGNLRVSTSGSAKLSTLNITAATVVKAAPGYVGQLSVVTVGDATTVGAVYDNSLTTGLSAANKIFTIPNVVGSYPVNFPAAVGIVVVPGTVGQVVALAFN